MKQVRIRGATPDDVPFLRRMQWEALMASPRFVSAMGLDNLRRIEDRAWAAWPAPGETAFVAEDAQGRPLGALILRVQERDGERVVGHRLAVAVAAEARRPGLGRQLLEHAKHFSQAAGAAYVLLYVDPRTTRLCRRISRPGFDLGMPTASSR